MREGSTTVSHTNQQETLADDLPPGAALAGRARRGDALAGGAAARNPGRAQTRGKFRLKGRKRGDLERIVLSNAISRGRDQACRVWKPGLCSVRPVGPVCGGRGSGVAAAD